MSMTGLLAQDMVMSGVRVSFPSHGNGASVSGDSYFRGNPFEGNCSPFGAILTLEEIADRYGLRE